MPLVIAPWAGGQSSAVTVDILRRLRILETALQNNGAFENFTSVDLPQTFNDIFSGNFEDAHNFASDDVYSALDNVFSGNYIDDSTYQNSELQNALDEIFSPQS